MRVLIGCECSQVECKAFRAAGYDAYSCDIQDCYGGFPEWHIKGDLFSVVNPNDFDLAILHPPCTYLSRINNFRYLKSTGVPDSCKSDFESAVRFFRMCLNYPVNYLCVENPIPHPLCRLPPYSTIVHPYHFGHPFTKATCYWLKNLPLLLPTCFVLNPSSWCYRPGHYSTVDGRCSKSRMRSQSFPGIASAMASQWGNYVDNRLRVQN